MQEFEKYQTEQICSIEKIGVEKTFDIENKENDFFLDEPNFLADNFLVHNCSRHAGGIVILDRPVYEIMPVEKVSGEVITAFEESGNSAVLDEIGVIKLDILGLSTLDVVNDTLDKVDEKLYLIEDDDGIRKIVPQSYIDKELEVI